jgi:plastocyanin
MRRFASLLTALAVAAVPAVALAHDDVKPKTHTVKTGDDFFSPKKKTIHVKDVVKWVWVGADGKPGFTVNEHTIVESKNRFSSDAKTAGTFKYRFKKAGKFTIYCAQHTGTMKLTVTVKK